MPVVNLYNKNLRCDVGFFGSALTTNQLSVISPYTNVGGTVVSTLPNTHGSILSGWGKNSGGWSNWNPSSSVIPADSKVEFAFLYWSSAYLNISGSPPSPSVILTKPDTTTIPIAPTPAYSLSQNAGWVQYTNGANVTTIMQDNQFGDYYLTGVPTGTLYGSAQAGAGTWGMFILYSHPSFKYRNANLNVAATGFNTSITVGNLVVPPTGAVEAKILIAGVQGDKGTAYPDKLLLNGTALSGPFNPVNDFMNSSMVDYTGLSLQTKGALIVQTGTQYGYGSDQTVITNNSILTNSTTQATLTQDNASDWAGLPFVGFLIEQNSAQLTPVKSVDKAYCSIGDTLNYTLSFSNAGSTTALNILVIDTLPSGLTLVPNSLTINSSPSTQDITKGVTLPNLAIGAGYQLTFQATATQLNANNVYKNNGEVSYNFVPSGSTLLNTVVDSNIVTTSITNITLNSTKQVNKNYAFINDILTYTISCSNTGSSAAYNVLFKDTIPNGTTFVANSLYQDLTPVSGSPNPLGVTLPNPISQGSTSIISYKVVVSTIPNPNPISNSATIIGYYDTTPSAKSTSSNTNIVNTAVNFASLSGVKKSVDKAYATCGDVITYTIVVPNTGTVTAQNIIFKDTIPNGTSFVTTSVYINGIQQFGANPGTGVTIPNIAPGTTATLTFSVQVQC